MGSLIGRSSLMPAKINVLDHGYIQLIESWGSDERIKKSARISTNKGFQGWDDMLYSCSCHNPDTCPKCKGKGNYTIHGDVKLLRYLYVNKHMTPFEMAGCIVE